MDKPQSAIDRVRPMLQAMERSVDAARRRRLHEDEPVAQPHDPHVPVSASRTNDDEPPRLKARPKRTTPPVARPNGSSPWTGPTPGHAPSRNPIHGN